MRQYSRSLTAELHVGFLDCSFEFTGRTAIVINDARSSPTSRYLRGLSQRVYADEGNYEREHVIHCAVLTLARFRSPTSNKHCSDMISSAQYGKTSSESSILPPCRSRLLIINRHRSSRQRIQRITTTTNRRTPGGTQQNRFIEPYDG